MRFFGTGAADVIPSPFCDCPICRDARIRPEHRRLRSAFLLDDRNLIDCGPDISASAMLAGADLSNVRNIFITHTHEDHFCPSNAGVLRMSAVRRNMPADVYMSEAAYESCVTALGRLGKDYAWTDAMRGVSEEIVRLHTVRTGERFFTDGYSVLAVPTTHRVSETECAVNYLFERDGRKLLYACDTGLYPEESKELLRGTGADILIMDATWGSLSPADRPSINLRSHLNAETFAKQLGDFLEAGIIREDTKVYATHINHFNRFYPEQYQEWFDRHTPFDVKVASDGMEI